MLGGCSRPSRVWAPLEHGFCQPGDSIQPVEGGLFSELLVWVGCVALRLLPLESPNESALIQFVGCQLIFFFFS